MYCPKCGTKNPDKGKFCRTCGTDLKVVSAALKGKFEPKSIQTLRDKKGKSVSWESAFGKLFTGLAFIGVTVALANSVVGTGWWFWMLIPSLALIGSGLAQIVQIKAGEKSNARFVSTENERELSGDEKGELPPSQTEYVSPVPESKYETGDLAPPSVTENTTRHLEMDSEGETMTLPKSNL